MTFVIRASFISLMQRSAMIQPRLLTVDLPLRYLHPAKSSFFKLEPEPAMACQLANQVGSVPREALATEKDVIFLPWAHPWTSHTAVATALSPMIFFSAWGMKSNGAWTLFWLIGFLALPATVISTRLPCICLSLDWERISSSLNFPFSLA